VNVDLITETVYAYEAVKDAPACPHCGEGESWSVKGPDGALIGQSWTGDNAECEAEEMAQMLNAAFEAGKSER
jgi:hypothetical protein